MAHVKFIHTVYLKYTIFHICIGKFPQTIKSAANFFIFHYLQLRLYVYKNLLEITEV